jgi:hypothetical protein
MREISVSCFGRFFADAREPFVATAYLLADEFFIVECLRQRGDALAPGQHAHRQCLGLSAATQLRKMPAQPVAKQAEDLVRMAERGVFELCQLRAKCAHRTAVQQNLCPVRDEDVDEAADALRRCRTFGLPFLQDRPRVLQPQVDHGLKDLIPRLEVECQVSSRNPRRRRDVGDGHVLESLLINQTVGVFDDAVAGARGAHASGVSSHRIGQMT